MAYNMKIDEALIKRILEGTSSREEMEALHWLKAEGELDSALAKLIESKWETYQATSWENEEIASHRILEGIHGKIIDHQELPPKVNATTPSTTHSSQRFDILYIAKVAAVLLIFLSSVWLIAVNIKKNQKRSELTASNLVHKSVSFGEKRTFYLPDGTTVMLNSGSELTYPNSFDQETDRTVELHGEGFFVVARDIKKPFRVHTGSYLTTALGTSFNISSNQEKVQVALVTGKVKVSRGKSSVLLAPGEMADCNLVVGDINKKAYDAEAVLGWKEGTIKFQSSNIGEVSELLEHWYGIKVRIDPALPLDMKVTGTFNNENLKSIVEGLCFTLDCRFTMNDKEVKIIKN